VEQVKHAALAIIWIRARQVSSYHVCGSRVLWIAKVDGTSIPVLIVLAGMLDESAGESLRFDKVNINK
jgi:hypothetical protein